MSGGRILENQVKCRKLAYKGEIGQTVKKTESNTTGTDPIAARKDAETVNRTSQLDKANVSEGSRLTEVNGIRKDLVSQEKRRRLSLMDDKELPLAG